MQSLFVVVRDSCYYFFPLLAFNNNFLVFIYLVIFVESLTLGNIVTTLDSDPFPSLLHLSCLELK